MARIERELPQVLKDKFTLTENTLSREVKPNPKDRIQIEVGDSKQPDFKPQFKFMRWDNEVNFSLRAEEHPQATVEFEGEKIKYITPDYEVHQYDKPEAGEDGGFEFEWVLPKKPASNVLKATIQTKGLDFIYQPALTQQEIDEGVSRPENVVGSYAVYHSTKGGLNRSDGMEYKVGKAFHIYRPKVSDVAGNETWGELSIDKENGLLKVTIDQTWLDDVLYPIIVDPTFGTTSIGGTNAALGNFRYANAKTLAEDGTVTSITFYCAPGGSTCDLKAALYDTAGNPNLLANCTELSNIPDVDDWYLVDTVDYEASASDYILAMATSAALNIKYDTTGSTVWKADDGITYAQFPENPWTPSTNSTGRLFSVYGTYTAAGGGAVAMNWPVMTGKHFWGPQISG